MVAEAGIVEIALAGLVLWLDLPQARELEQRLLAAILGAELGERPRTIPPSGQAGEDDRDVEDDLIDDLTP